MGMAEAAPIIGSVLGGAMSDNGSTGSTQTIQRADPWSGVQPGLNQLYSSALQNFLGPGQQYYPNSTVAPQSPSTQFGQQSLYGRAMGGSPLLQGAQDQAQQTLGGQYFNNPATAPLNYIGSGGMLNNNPWLDQTFNRAAQPVSRAFSNTVMPGIASMFSGAGRYGSNQMADAMSGAEQNYGRTLADLGTSIYGGNYGAERMLQQQALGEMGTQFGRERALQAGAMGQAPGLANADYTDINALLGLGGSQDAYTQSLLNSDVSRWDFGQQQPMNRLQQLNQLLQGASPYASSQTSMTGSVPTNPLQGALGGGMLGQSIYSNLFGGTGSNPAQGLTLGGSGLGLTGGGYLGLNPSAASLGSLWPSGGGSSGSNMYSLF